MKSQCLGALAGFGADLAFDLTPFFCIQFSGKLAYFVVTWH
jgi:hypothetical protein